MKDRIRTEDEKIQHLERLNILNSSVEHREHLKRLNSSPEQKEQLKRIHLSMKGRQRPDGSGVPCVSVEVLDTLNNETKVYPSIAEAARAIGVTKASISMAFKRQGVSTI
jgi:hypothetical protein